MNKILKQGSTPLDFVLTEESDYISIHVRNLTVYIKRGDEGVTVEIQGDPDEDCLTESWATFAEGTSEGGGDE